MDVRILCVPWDAGHRDERMGRGPGALLHGALADGLRGMGHRVEVETVGPHADYLASAFHTEIATSFSVWHSLMERVAAARADGRFPVVLTGNCGATLGVVGGLGRQPADGELGVVWMDAHGDLNTPDTSASGFLDGMTLAALVGRCWRALTLRTPGFAVPENHVLHLGGRDLDPAEAELLAASGIRRLDVDALRTPGRLDVEAERLAERVTRLHLHVDLDVLDPRVAPANTFVALPSADESIDVSADVSVDDSAEVSADGSSGADNADGPARLEGLSADELVAATSAVAERIRPDALTLSAYDPAADPGGLVPPIALRLVASVLRTASAR